MPVVTISGLDRLFQTKTTTADASKIEQVVIELKQTLIEIVVLNIPKLPKDMVTVVLPMTLLPCGDLVCRIDGLHTYGIDAPRTPRMCNYLAEQINTRLAHWAVFQELAYRTIETFVYLFDPSANGYASRTMPVTTPK